MAGWIKIYRKIADWEWWDNSYMVHLFLHLLITANIEEKKWHDVVVKRGQLIVTIKGLSATLNISEQTIRTCLKRLEDSGVINKQITNKYTIVTICKYEDYQEQNFQEQHSTNRQTTGNQQTTNSQLTTTKEYKNTRIEEKENIILKDNIKEKNFGKADFSNSVQPEAPTPTPSQDKAKRRSPLDDYGEADFIRDLEKEGIEHQTAVDLMRNRRGKNLQPTRSACQDIITELKAHEGEYSVQFQLNYGVVNGWGGYKFKWLIRQLEEDSKDNTKKTKNGNRGKDNIAADGKCAGNSEEGAPRRNYDESMWD